MSMKPIITKIDTPDDVIEKINDKLDEILELSQIYKLPMYASVAIKNSEEGTEYTSVVYNPSSHQIGLKDDRIRKHMLIANGFEVVPPREKVSIDMNDFMK